MADLISREALLKELATHYNKVDGKTLYHPSMALAMHDVRAAPTIDPASLRPKGKWICLEAEIGYFACSLCDHRILRAECNFCPNCGCQMGGNADAH